MTALLRPGPPRRTVLLGAVAVSVLAACGDDPEAAPAPRKAAEPASAPSPTTPPAGLSIPVGAAAEGVVHDPATGLLVVGVRDPNRVLVLDPDTLAVRRAVTVPGTVRHLQVVAGGGRVLAPNEAADTLLELDLRTGATRTTAVGHVPHDAAGTADGELLVGDEFGGSLTVVRDGRVVHTFDDLTQPGGVVAAGRSALVVDVGDFTVSAYDLDRFVRTARLPAGDGPTHGVLAGPDRLAVTDTRGDRLLLFALDPLREVTGLDVPGSPYGLAADAGTGTVWVTLTATNEVLGVDVSGGSPRVVDRLPTVRQPNTVAVAPGARTLWVTGTADGVLQRIAR